MQVECDMKSPVRIHKRPRLKNPYLIVGWEDAGLVGINAIDYLTDNKELQELITMQGVGIAGEALEEVRERTVSADDFFEGVVRAFLRRTPRKRLEAPSREVRLRTVHIRPPEDEK